MSNQRSEWNKTKEVIGPFLPQREVRRDQQKFLNLNILPKTNHQTKNYNHLGPPSVTSPHNTSQSYYICSTRPLILKQLSHVIDHHRLVKFLDHETDLVALN